MTTFLEQMPPSERALSICRAMIDLTRKRAAAEAAMAAAEAAAAEAKVACRKARDAADEALIAWCIEFGVDRSLIYAVENRKNEIEAAPGHMSILAVDEWPW